MYIGERIQLSFVLMFDNGHFFKIWEKYITLFTTIQYHGCIQEIEIFSMNIDILSHICNITYIFLTFNFHEKLLNMKNKNSLFPQCKFHKVNIPQQACWKNIH